MKLLQLINELSELLGEFGNCPVNIQRTGGNDTEAAEICIYTSSVEGTVCIGNDSFTDEEETL